MISIVFFLSVLALIPAWINYDIISMDGVMLYIPVARLFLEGNFYEALYGKYISLFPLPLYETLIFITAKITGLGLETSGRLVAAAAYVLGSIGMYRFSETVFKNRFTALISVLFYLSHRKLLEYSVDCLKESLLVCIILWASYSIFKGVESSSKKPSYIVSGLLLFLAGAMVRGTSLIFLLAWLVIWVFYKKKGMLNRAMASFLMIAMLAILVVLFPENQFFRNSLDLPNYLEKIGITYSSYLDILYGVYSLLRDFLAKTYYFLTIFGIIGIYQCRETLYAKHLAVTLLLFLEFMLGFGWNETGRESIRYITASIIYIIPIASYAVFSFLSSVKTPLRWVAVIVIISLPFLWAGKAFEPPDPDRLARKEAGEWILSMVGSGQDIVTNRIRIAFYAKGKTAMISTKVMVYSDHKKIPTKTIAWTSRFGGFRIKDIVDGKTLKKIVVIDYSLDEYGKSWIIMLDNLGIKPDKVIRSIYIYLPHKEN
jgi:hypothetical protein